VDPYYWYTIADIGLFIAAMGVSTYMFFKMMNE